jgi:flagellin-like protein
LTKIGNVRNITKFRRSIKAISPVIATLLMIAIAVVASLVVYAWVTGYIGGATTTAGNAVQVQSAVRVGDTYVIYVQNVGQGPVKLRGIGGVYINDQLAPLVPNADVDIIKGQTEEITVDASGITLVSGESVKIKVVADGGTSSQYTLTGTDPVAPPGTFALTVTIDSAGTGDGAVTFDPAGPNYAPDTPVTITAEPDTGSDFAGWGGGELVGSTTNPVVVTMTASKTFTATFNLEGGSSGDIPFSDDFETDSFSSTYWPIALISGAHIQNRPSSTDAVVHLVGQSGVDDYVTLEISTLGYTSIQLSYDRMFSRDHDSPDYMIVEWHVGTGTGGWTTLQSLSAEYTSWGSSGVLALGTDGNGASAANQAVIQIRFKLDQCENTADNGYFDDVLVTGTAL